MRDTVVLTLVSFALAFVVGTIVAGFRVSPVPPLRAAGTAYVNIVRNTPLAVLMVLFWFGLLPTSGSACSRFWAGIIVLTAYTARSWPRRSGRGSTRWPSARPRRRGRWG